MKPIHILILGGDVKFLPLAKSKVRELAARVGPNGYGSQKILIGSTTIMVEVKGGVQHIRLIGADELFMDTGAVDIKAVTVLDPAIGSTDGTLNYNLIQAAQAALKKLLSKIAPPSLSGTPTADAAATPAFSAEVIDGVRDSTSEDLLAVKKACSKIVPPSLFTGKMRLYFQANYGARLARWRWTYNQANQPPSLDAAIGSKQFTFHPGLCGIYTDSKKRHWLVQIAMDGASAYAGVTIHRMRGNTQTEILRPMLLDESLSSLERERIEAYILSASLPDPDYKVQFPMVIPATFSMGYGWHFNWSGSSADIVAQVASPFGGGFQYTSSHYRISIARNDINDSMVLADEAARWTVTKSTESQQTWGNLKWQNVITYPDWAEQKLSVFGSNFGLAAAQDAPVYCFWRRAEGQEILEIVRHNYQAGTPGLRGSFISDPPYYFGCNPEAPGVVSQPGCATQGATIGLEGSRYDQNSFPETATLTAFKTTSVSLSMSMRNSTSTSQWSTKKTWSLGTTFGGTPGLPAQNILDGLPGGIPVFASQPGNFCPIGPASGSGFLTGVTPFGGTQTTYGCIFSWIRFTGSIVNTESGRSLMVIPFGDSEAVYLWASKYRQTITTITSRRQMGSAFNSLGYQKYHFMQNSGQTFNWVDYGSDIDSNHFGSFLSLPDPAVEVTPDNQLWTLVGSKCISNAGIKDTTFSPSGQFFAGDPTEFVDQQLLTLTSTGGDIKGEGINLTGDYHPRVANAPFVFVGWA